MSDAGTSLESLETGTVANTADAERMAAILRDMNAAGDAADTADTREPMPSFVPRMPMPPSNSGASGWEKPEAPPAEYTEVPRSSKGRRGNFFSTLFERVKEPLLVACILFVLSLPFFHTAAAKVVPWAFAMGGELSYLGLIVKSLFAGGLFAIAQMGLAFL
jgi:hypothetical protein